MAHFVERCCWPSLYSVKVKVYETKQESPLLVLIHLFLREKYQN